MPAQTVVRQGEPLNDVGSTEFTPQIKKGISLSNLLEGVSQAVSHAYRAGVWVMVEVVELRANGGHVFLGVSERDAYGSVLAKASAVIWQSTANTILATFERATGAELAPGIKLLVRARPVFKSVHGFTLEIDAIDPEYTLGDLEARKREIRERLQAEGIFAANKRLPVPSDFNAVLVVAPAGGAGLGDFQAEANRLEQFGVCQFIYSFSRFQGEGSAREICEALRTAMSHWVGHSDCLPDAIVIIRGGGAVNDLAWLNDYSLARCICKLPVPVLTGIGHERDTTVLDEVANCRYDTPSKVITGIEQTIAKRVAEAESYFEQVSSRAVRAVQGVSATATSLDALVRGEAIRHLSQGKQSTTVLFNDIKFQAIHEVRSASELSSDAFQQINTKIQVQVLQVKQMVPAMSQQIFDDIKRSLHASAVSSEVLLTTVLGEAQRDASQSVSRAEDALASVSTSAKQMVRSALLSSGALIREITGQGPEKTLSRGFALVRDQSGYPITRADRTASGASIEIQFCDGKLAAIAGQQQL